MKAAMQFKKVQIEVTDKMIKNGTPSDAYICPVALACKAAGITTNGVARRVYWPEVSGIYPPSTPLPRAAWNFLKKFDEGKPVKPFKFTLKVPVSCLRKQAHGKAKKSR